MEINQFQLGIEESLTDLAVELFERIVNLGLQNREIVEAAINFEAKRFNGRRMADIARCYYQIGDLPGSRDARHAYERSAVKHINHLGEELYFLDAVAYEIARRGGRA